MQTHKVRRRSRITCHSKANSSNCLLEKSAGTTVCLLYSSIDLPKKTIHCSTSQRLLLMCLPKAFLQTFLVYYASFIGVWGTWGDEEALHLVWFSGRQQWSGDLQRWCRSFSCLPAHHLRLLMMMWPCSTAALLSHPRAPLSWHRGPRFTTPRWTPDAGLMSVRGRSNVRNVGRAVLRRWCLMLNIRWAHIKIRQMRTSLYCYANTNNIALVRICIRPNAMETVVTKKVRCYLKSKKLLLFVFVQHYITHCT